MLGSNNRLITPTSPPHTQTHPLYRVLLIFHNKPGAVYRPELQDPAVGDKSTNLGAGDREHNEQAVPHHAGGGGGQCLCRPNNQQRKYVDVIATIVCKSYLIVSKLYYGLWKSVNQS